MTAVTLLDSLPDLLSPPEGDEWAWWTAAVGGLRVGGFQPLAPQTGFYRFRPRKSVRGEPCAIYWEHGRWWCLIGDRVEDDVALAWRFSHGQPISHELYEAVLAGAPWPDEVAAAVEVKPTLGHNSAPPEESIFDEIKTVDRAFQDWLASIGGAITEDAQDQVAQGYDDRLRALRQRADAAEDNEKKPHHSAWKAVLAKWKPIVALVVAAEDRVSKACTPFRVERDRQERAARAAVQIETTERAGAPIRPKGFRSIPKVIIDDLPAVAMHFASMKDPPADLIEVCRVIAGRHLIRKDPIAVPGAHVETIQKA